jgi:hypothetical protein
MKIFLPPPYTNLGLIKRLVKAMVNTIQNDSSTRVKKFSKINTAKLKEGIFVGSRIRENLEDEAFVESLTDIERTAWESFNWVERNS